MSEAYEVPYRVESLQTNLGITPACPAVVAQWARPQREDGRESFNVNKLNLISITKKDSGECLFACIAMAVYGTEDYHRLVRKIVCDFIEHKIIPNYHTLSNDDKVTFMLQFEWIAPLREGSHHESEPYDLATFNTNAAEYIRNMRGRHVCGRSLELSVASYIFRMQILIIQKHTRLQNRTRDVTYSRLQYSTGHESLMSLVENDGIGRLWQATPHKAAEIQSVVFWFSAFEVIHDDEVAGRPALNSVQRQASMLDKETSRVGHYQLMAMRRDDADQGPSGSGKKVAKKKHKSHNGAAGAADEGSEDTSDEDMDQDDYDDAHQHIRKLREKIQKMKDEEYDLLHTAKKRQQKLDDDYKEHMTQMQTHANSSGAHIVRENEQLRNVAALYAKKIENSTNERMLEISTAQAQLKEHMRKSRGVNDPNDELFGIDLEYYLMQAKNRHAKHIELHQNRAAVPKHAAVLKSAANYDIAREKIHMQEQEKTRQDKIQRSNTKTRDFQTLLDTISLSVNTAEDRLKITKIQANLQAQIDYRMQLEAYKEGTESRLAYLEALNNGAGDMWIEANPRLYLKYGHRKISGL